jgi:hypothetical protein
MGKEYGREEGGYKYTKGIKERKGKKGVKK